MDFYFKLLASVIFSAICSLVLSKGGKDYGLLLTLAVTSMLMISVIQYLQPVITFLRHLTEIGQLKSELLGLLLKVCGIGLISQIAGMVCADAGNQTLTKALEILTTVTILWVSLPILEELLTLFEDIMGAL